MKTVIAVIVDRSGSMMGKELDVMGGIAKLVDDQKKAPGEALFTLVQFDNEYEVVFPLADIRAFDRYNRFVPRGSTALLDAIGRTLNDVGAAIQDRQVDKVIVAVITDGQENCSREFTRERVKEMIAHAEKHGWTFLYLGADIRSFADAQSIGVNAANFVNYANTSAGTQAAYGAVSQSMVNMRSGASASNLRASYDASLQKAGA